MTSNQIPMRRFANRVDGVLENLAILFEVLIKVFGIPALLSLDVIVGGIVVHAMFVRDEDWRGVIAAGAVSIATSLVVMYTWHLLLTNFRLVKLPWVLPAIVASVIDGAFDVRIITLRLYGADETINGGWMPPDPTWGWQMGTALAVCLTVALEPMMIGVIKWLRRGDQ